MHLPIWVTVFISGIVGSWVGGALSSILFLPVLFGHQPPALASHWVAVLLAAAVGQLAVTAVVLMLLLPPLLDVRAGFGTTFIATAAGNLVVLIATLLLLSATVRGNLSGGGMTMMPAFGLASLFLTVIGVAVTATVVGSAVGSGSGGGLAGYGGQSYFDEYRNG